MGRARRLLRGRGRALALVAAASVAWLLLDAAALRLCFGGGGTGGGAGAAAERGGGGPGAVEGQRRGPRGAPPAARRGRGRLGEAGGSPGGSPAAAAKPRVAPTGSGAATGAAGAATDAAKPELGGGAGPRGASPTQGPAAARRDGPPPPDSPAPARVGPAEQNGTGARAAEAAEAAAKRGRHRPDGTRAAVGSRGLPARAAPGDGETAAGEPPAAPGDPFVRVSKEGASTGGPDAGGNGTRGLEGRPERRRESGKSEGIPAASTAAAATASRSLRRAAPAGGPSKGSSRVPRTARSPGTHRVLAVDATLAPRDPRAPGQFGHAVAVPEDKQEEAKSRWKEGNFNVYLSDLIPVDRAVVDTRPAGCSEQRVHNDLPTTTIIMCFVDEVWSTLLRSVHSVLSRSPPHLIEEVILVDDFSAKDYLKEKLDKYMSQFPKVKILHLKERHGLIRARLAGAEIAKGDVLTFLDSHVECNVGWLEPLLERVRRSRTKVACPVIEVISDKDMSYMTVDNFQRGIFTWPMNFGWRQIPQEVIEKNKMKETDIIRCPVMAGGLFSIDKKYFFELGAYDPGLDVWGGENMELSFKVWMCGGEIEIIPCSRVGHIFRNDNPYSFPEDRIRTVERNLARVAEVWLDEYKDLFYGHAYHLILKNLDVGDLTQQIELRKKLQCKSFKWYLENVYPDLEAPLVRASGLLVNTATARCIAVENNTLAFEACDVNNEDQQFNYTWLRLLQHGEACVAPAAAAAGGAPGLRRCDGRNPRLKWLHMALAPGRPQLTDHVVVEHLAQPACLEADPARGALRVGACDSASPFQKWRFGSYHVD